MKKTLKILGLVLALSFFIISCSNKDVMPTKLTLEDSIKEIILSKGESYDFLKDNGYIEYMENLVNELAQDSAYAIGNLDEDNIPELAIFNVKDHNDINDEGSLEIYSFNGSKYSLLDTINMSFDNSNYGMEIGKISENQRGLFLNNNIGTHSGLTYGFILEDGKLKSILNDKKISLISIYAENKIKDINNDGILNFSIVTIDPETEDTTIEGSNKMTLWYKWNGKDSANLIEVEREDYSKIPSNKELYSEGARLISENLTQSLDYIIENKDELSKYDTSMLLEAYIGELNELSLKRGIKINDLFLKDENDANINYMTGNHSTNLENLNSIEYLSREKVLKDNKEIKEHLIDNINLGLKLDIREGSYYYLVDYERFIDLFNENILSEYMDYFKFLAFNSNQPFMNEGSLVIGQEQLIERILFIESFKILYPYSKFLPEVHDRYTTYINIYLFGDLHNPNFDHDTKIMTKESLEAFEEFVKNYEFTSLSYIINDFLQWLEENDNVVDDIIREKLYNRLI